MSMVHCIEISALYILTHSYIIAFILNTNSNKKYLPINSEIKVIFGENTTLAFQLLGKINQQANKVFFLNERGIY